LAEYRGKWLIYSILKQYLGTHSRTRTKDLAMEAEEGRPDHNAIKIYLKDIGVPRMMQIDMHSEDDELSQEGDDESSNDEEEESDREAKVRLETF
jgi:hypothetical protein